MPFRYLTMLVIDDFGGADTKHKTINMIAFTHFKLMHREAFVSCNPVCQFLQVFLNLSREYLASVLHGPHQMIIDIADAGPVMNGIALHADILSE